MLTQDQLLALINSAIAFGTVIMLGAIGEILIEKAGNLNLGIPGIMYLGGIGGMIAAFYYEIGGGASTRFETVVCAGSAQSV